MFDTQQRKWLLIDVFHNFHVVDEATGQALSALEFRDALLGRRGPAKMRANGPGRPGFAYEETAIDYYTRGIHQWYLWWGNAVFSYYAHPLIRLAGRLSPSLAHIMAALLDLQPRIRILTTSENASLVERMFSLRRRLLVIGGLSLLLIVTLVFQLTRLAT